MDSKEHFKYGYYTAGPFNHITTSKLEAIEWCMPQKSWPTWHLHDEVFASYDWTQEPTQSLEELYQQRARELRARYDYLIVKYSGGYDSHNMLMSFLSQGIVPDEILNFYHSYDDDTNVLGQEWRLQTGPQLQQILTDFPQIKLRRVDLTPLVLDHMNNGQFENDCYFHLGRAVIRPNAFVRTKFSSLVRDLAELKNQGKKIRLLQGTDKPRLRYHDKKFILNFYDTASDSPVQDIENDDIEWFYWSADSATMLIKQAHVAKRYWMHHIEQLQHKGATWDNNLGWVLPHNHDPLCRLIYPWHGGRIFLVEKPWHGIVGSRDRGIMNANYERLERYKKIAFSVISRLDKMYFNQQDPTRGPVGSISRDYFIS
jgi:hypothetical protein